MKLEHIGVRGQIYKLLQNYLQNRTQCVSLNGTISNRLPITCGVPQGSILGPLLFLIYINDIYRSSSILKFILFADDTTIFISGSSLPELYRKLNSELILVSDWFKANKLSLNIT